MSGTVLKKALKKSRQKKKLTQKNNRAIFFIFSHRLLQEHQRQRDRIAKLLCYEMKNVFIASFKHT